MATATRSRTGLTPVEKQVHDMLAHGKKPKEIAKRRGTTDAAVYTVITRLRKQGKLPIGYESNGHSEPTAAPKVEPGASRVKDEIAERADALLSQARKAQEALGAMHVNLEEDIRTAEVRAEEAQRAVDALIGSRAAVESRMREFGDMFKAIPIGDAMKAS